MQLLLRGRQARRPGRCARSWMLCAVTAATVAAPGLALGEADVLERPALASWRATSAAVLALAAVQDRIVAVGERGVVLLSDDNAATWRQASVPVSVTLTGVRFANGQVGWAVGHEGVVLRTVDGGQTWQKQFDGKMAAELTLRWAKQRAERAPSDAGAQRLVADAERLVADGPDKPFFDLWFFNEKDGFVVGAYGLIFGTNDGGQSWQNWQERLENPKGHHLYAIDVDRSDIYLAGEQGALYHSTDSGNSFRAVKTPYDGTYFGVRHVGGGAVLAFGLRGNAYRSADGQTQWQKVPITNDSALNASGALRDGSVVLVDQSGRLLRSGDGAKTFRIDPKTQGFALAAIAQAADGAVVLGGLGGLTRVAPTPAIPEGKR